MKEEVIEKRNASRLELESGQQRQLRGQGTLGVYLER